MYFNEYVENDSVVDSVSTTKTQFFHGPGRLLFIEHHLFPEWEAQVASGSRARHIRIWSSASADRDEPYSLAFTLLERFPATSGWRIEVLTTDLSTREGDESCASDKSTEKGPQDEIEVFETDLGPIVEFHRVNLKDDVSLLGGPFDLIWCGNVLTYFNYVSKERRGNPASNISPRRDRSKTRTQ